MSKTLSEVIYQGKVKGGLKVNLREALPPRIVITEFQEGEARKRNYLSL